jgi:hypothetical protein
MNKQNHFRDGCTSEPTAAKSSHYAICRNKAQLVAYGTCLQPDAATRVHQMRQDHGVLTGVTAASLLDTVRLTSVGYTASQSLQSRQSPRTSAYHRPALVSKRMQVINVYTAQSLQQRVSGWTATGRVLVGARSFSPPQRPYRLRPTSVQRALESCFFGDKAAGA